MSQTENSSEQFQYHVLLIGCDTYLPPYDDRSLQGCVNDIDAVENLLFDWASYSQELLGSTESYSVRPEQIKLIRLASPAQSATSTSRFKDQTRLPTKENIIQALTSLTAPTVRENDRVLVYYSGHGIERKWPGELAYHEAIVPVDGKFLYDLEINILINAIAARTSDLTVVLDCCHSGGATRDITFEKPKTRSRLLMADDLLANPPDPAVLKLANTGTARGSTDTSTSLLKTPDPNYLAVVACAANETAQEGKYASIQIEHGILTFSLLKALETIKKKNWAQLRWTDIWPHILNKVNQGTAELKGSPQHPWLIGRSERKVFGGAWQPMDPGLKIEKGPGQGVDFIIGAGGLMNITEGAKIGVYGDNPPYFPVLDSQEDLAVRYGLLEVIKAEHSSATARVISPPFELPRGARGRLVEPGKSNRLRVYLAQADDGLRQYLETSPLLQLVDQQSEAEVAVIINQAGEWVISNEVVAQVAVVPPQANFALKAGLEHYFNFNSVLRLARASNDTGLKNKLEVRLLDCNDEEQLQAANIATDPKLPEAPRDQGGDYDFPNGFKFCIRVTNFYQNTRHDPLNVTVFNCTAGGEVEYLGDLVLRERDSQVLWSGSSIGSTFVAYSTNMLKGSLDRLVVVATTKPGVDLSDIRLDKSVQQVIDDLTHQTRGQRPFLPPTAKAGVEKPAELWTAIITNVKIGIKA